MAPFWSRNNGSRGDDVVDDLSATRHVSKGNLLSLTPDVGSDGMGRMKKVQSMLEMNDIHNMVQFGEAMDALSIGQEDAATEDKKSHPLSKKISVNQDQQDDDDDGGFFIDGPEEDDIDCDDGKFLCLSSSPDSVVDLPQASASPSSMGGGGMRRVMSQMSLSSAQRQRCNLSVVPEDIHPISEEDDHNDGADDTLKKNSLRHNYHGANEERTQDIKSSDRNSSNLGESSHSDTNNGMNVREQQDSAATVGSEYCVSISSVGDRAETSPAARRSSRGMPLKSSMKNSSNSLRSSIKSNSSTELNDTNHSMESNHSGTFSNASKRNVSFSSLEIRSYNVTLGDAPTSCGPPISLDWEYDPTRTAEYDIDHYENFRTDEAPRRNRKEMLMPANHRQYLLMREAGFTRGEINAAMEEAKRVAKRRAKTVKGVRLGLQPVEEVLESTRRKFGKLTSSLVIKI